MANNVGQVIVICPVCGESLQGEVCLSQVQVWGTSLQALFRVLTLDHDCPGGT